MTVLYLYACAFGLLWVIAAAVELGIAMYINREKRATFMATMLQMFIGVIIASAIALPGVAMIWWSVSHLLGAA